VRFVKRVSRPASVIRVILEGARTVTTDARPTPSTMPAYGWKLSDQEVAAVASFVRNAWGNSAPAVTADDVKKLRKNLTVAGHAPPGEKR
jgi:mono/diheme cytochrome c family protein